MMDYLEKYNAWSNSDYFDIETKDELRSIKDNDAEIKERFYKDLEFGTGGLRGIIGVGTNRMNIYTVRKATQGLANFIISEKGQDKGVAIAYDSRNMSSEFADEAALCLAANGIKAYVFESLRPTPMLSFAIRELGCISGIVVTASHNPPEYNGYKAYWEDGAQLTYPKDEAVINEVNLVEDYSMVKTMPKEKAIEEEKYITIGKDIDDLYINALKSLVIDNSVINEVAKDIKIVYTPLHGTGGIPVQRVLKELGFSQVYVVKEQEKPDGNFPTVDYPNPEDPKAFTLALKLAKEVDADIVLATDPDADRLGVYAKDTKSGEYISFTGNMSGMLIAEYILSKRTENGTLPDNGALIKTIVTTNMADVMTKSYNVKLIEVLTGFKYIGEQIKIFEEKNEYEYLFGLEESYGCLVGTFARDKDAVGAVMALCEVAAYCKKQNKTLWDEMIRLYEKYGYFKEGLYSITLKGIDGSEQIKALMEKLRNNAPTAMGDLEVLDIYDYTMGIKKNLKTGIEEKINLPYSNVLYYALSNDSWCCARPSGTEPKIKFYMGVKGDSLEDSEKKLQQLTEELKKIID